MKQGRTVCGLKHEYCNSQMEHGPDVKLQQGAELYQVPLGCKLNIQPQAEKVKL